MCEGIFVLYICLPTYSFFSSLHNMPFFLLSFFLQLCMRHFILSIFYFLFASSFFLSFFFKTEKKSSLECSCVGGNFFSHVSTHTHVHFFLSSIHNALFFSSFFNREKNPLVFFVCERFFFLHICPHIHFFSFPFLLSPSPLCVTPCSFLLFLYLSFFPGMILDHGNFFSYLFDRSFKSQSLVMDTNVTILFAIKGRTRWQHKSWTNVFGEKAPVTFFNEIP